MSSGAGRRPGLRVWSPNGRKPREGCGFGPGSLGVSALWSVLVSMVVLCRADSADRFTLPPSPPQMSRCVSRSSPPRRLPRSRNLSSKRENQVRFGLARWFPTVYVLAVADRGDPRGGIRFGSPRKRGEKSRSAQGLAGWVSYPAGGTREDGPLRRSVRPGRERARSETIPSVPGVGRPETVAGLRGSESAGNGGVDSDTSQEVGASEPDTLGWRERRAGWSEVLRGRRSSGGFGRHPESNPEGR